jgi:hypothetical protein
MNGGIQNIQRSVILYANIVKFTSVFLIAIT